MAMGFNAAGIASGIGQGMQQSADLWGRYLLQKDAQQNNPYLRLAAMRGMGGTTGAYPTANTTGEGSAAFSQRNAQVNAANYGKAGHPGGQSDEGGHFNPYNYPPTMSYDELVGDPGTGLAMRTQQMNAWQQQSEPMVRTYVETMDAYEAANQKKAMRTQQLQAENEAIGQKLKLLGTQQGSVKDPAELAKLENTVNALNIKLHQNAQEVAQMDAEIEGYNKSLQEWGGKIRNLLSPPYREERQGHPHYGKEAEPLVRFGNAANMAGRPESMADPRLHMRGPEGHYSLMTPAQLGEKFYPPGKAPAWLSASQYLPKNPR